MPILRAVETDATAGVAAVLYHKRPIGAT